MIVGSGPRTPQAEQAFAIAGHLLHAGHRLHLGLVQDAAIMALSRTRTPPPPAVPVYVLGEDLRLRGCREDDVAPGVKLVDYGELVELMMEQCDTVMGVF
jgi:sulfur relay protein TusB/DsrH